MRIKLLKPEGINGSLEFAGTVVDVEQVEGEALIRKGIAEKVNDVDKVNSLTPREETHG